MSNFLSHTVTLLVIKHTITPEHCTNIVPLCDKLYEAGQSCVCVFVMRPLRPIRVWPWRVLGNRWRRHANASALAHCRGRVRRCGPKSTYVYHIRLGVNILITTVITGMATVCPGPSHGPRGAVSGGIPEPDCALWLMTESSVSCLDRPNGSPQRI